MGKEKREQTENKKKKSNLVYNILLIFFALVFIGSAFYLFQYFYASKKSEDKVDELKNLIVEDDDNDENGSDSAASEPQFVLVDGKWIQKKYEKIYERNNAFVGWIKIKGTKVDYPVVQTPEDEEYYLRRDFDGERSTAGTVFVDTSSDIEKPSDNLLIYGHNMKAGTMFHDILKYEDEDFYKDHKYIQFNTIYGDGTYEVIAAFRTQIYAVDYEGFKYYQFFDAANAEEFNNFVSNCMRLTEYETDRTATYGDKLITLSTCSYHVDEGRFVVVAVKVSD